MPSVSNKKLPAPQLFTPHATEESENELPGKKLMGGRFMDGGGCDKEKCTGTKISNTTTTMTTPVVPPSPDLYGKEENNGILCASVDSSQNGIILLDQKQQDLHQSIQAPKSPTLTWEHSLWSPTPPEHQLTCNNVMNLIMGSGGSAAQLGNSVDESPRSSMFAYFDDDELSCTTTKSIANIEDEDIGSSRCGEDRDTEVSSAGGGSGTSRNTKEATRRAKRERRQRAKEGDIEPAFAGSGDMSHSILVGGSMREILQVHAGGAAGGGFGGSGYEWASPLLVLGRGRTHARTYSADTKDDTLANLHTTKLMGAETPPYPRQQGIPTTSCCHLSNNEAPKPTNSKRNDLRSGKRSLMAGWCNNVYTQHHDDQISNWIDLVPTNTSISPTPSVSQCVSSNASEERNLNNNESLDLSTKGSASTTEMKPQITSPTESRTTADSNRSFVRGIRDFVESFRADPICGDDLAAPTICSDKADKESQDGGCIDNLVKEDVDGAFSLRNRHHQGKHLSTSILNVTAGDEYHHHPDANDDFNEEGDAALLKDRSDFDDGEVEESGDFGDGCVGAPTSVPTGLSPEPEEGGRNFHSNLHRGHHHPTTLLGCTNELTGTASYLPYWEVEENVKQAPTNTFIGVLRGSTSRDSVPTKSRDGNVFTSLSTSPCLGFIFTQPIRLKQLKTESGRSSPKRATVSTVSLNECVYNLDHWDVDQYGWFVVPTDNVADLDAFDSTVVSLASSPQQISSGFVGGFPTQHYQETQLHVTVPTSSDTMRWKRNRPINTEREEPYTNPNTSAASTAGIPSLFGIDLPARLSSVTPKEIDDDLVCDTASRNPLPVSPDPVMGPRKASRVAGVQEVTALPEASSLPSFSTVTHGRNGNMHISPPTIVLPKPSASSAQVLGSPPISNGATSINAAITYCGLPTFTHNNSGSTSTTNNSTSTFTATDILTAYLTPSLSSVTTLSSSTGPRGAFSSPAAAAGSSSALFAHLVPIRLNSFNNNDNLRFPRRGRGCMTPMSVGDEASSIMGDEREALQKHDNRENSSNLSSSHHQIRHTHSSHHLLGEGLCSESTSQPLFRSSNTSINQATDWYCRLRMSLSLRQERTRPSSTDEENTTPSPILVDSSKRRYAMDSSVEGRSEITCVSESPSMKAGGGIFSSPVSWRVNAPLSPTDRTGTNTTTPPQCSSYPSFSDIISGYGVTVDTLTHAASNHTLQLAQPLTGDSARNYRRKEACTQPLQEYDTQQER